MVRSWPIVAANIAIKPTQLSLYIRGFLDFLQLLESNFNSAEVLLTITSIIFTMSLTKFGYENENINEFTIIKVSKIVRYTSSINN